MTDQGEHGGSSQHETESGLFVYSTEPMFTVRTNNSGKNDGSNDNTSVLSASIEPHSNDTCYANTTITNNSIHITTTLYWNDSTQAFEHTPLYNILTSPRVVPQIDFTPTISTLLGVPIPASSLGKVIPELFMIRKSTESNKSSYICGEISLLNTYFNNAMQVSCFIVIYSVVYLSYLVHFLGLDVAVFDDILE